MALHETLGKVAEMEDLDVVAASVATQVAHEDVKVNGTAKTLPLPPPETALHIRLVERSQVAH